MGPPESAPKRTRSATRSVAGGSSTLKSPPSATSTSSSGFVDLISKFKAAAANPTTPWELHGVDLDRLLIKFASELDHPHLLHSFIIDTGCTNTMSLFTEEVKYDMKTCGKVLPISDCKASISEYMLTFNITTLDGLFQRLQTNDARGNTVPKEDWPMRDWVYNAMYQFARLLDGKTNNKYGVKNHHSEMWLEMFVWKPLLDDFFINSPIIQLRRGDKVSDASAYRKNTADTVTPGDCNRKLGDSRKFGHRLDGIFVSQVSHHEEVGCLETGAKEEDPTGTKVLSDALKLGKALKDQHDHVTKFTAVPRTKFVVHGFQLNGLCIQFVTLDYVEGRFLRLQRTKMYKVPTEVSKIMDLLEIMVRLVAVFTDMHEAVELLSKPESIDPQSKIAVKRPTPAPNSGHCPTASSPK